MRKAPSALLLSVLVPLAGVVPVLSLPQAGPISRAEDALTRVLCAVLASVPLAIAKTNSAIIEGQIHGV